MTRDRLLIGSTINRNNHLANIFLTEDYSSLDSSLLYVRPISLTAFQIDECQRLKEARKQGKLQQASNPEANPCGPDRTFSHITHHNPHLPGVVITDDMEVPRENIKVVGTLQTNPVADREIAKFKVGG